MDSNKLTADEVKAMARGAVAFLDALGTVFPDAQPEDLVARAREVAGSPVAAELLHRVITLQKIRL